MSESPKRGLFHPSGRVIISSPTPEQIQAINSTPRAEYFSTLGPNPETIAKWSTHFGLHRIPGLLKPFTQKDSDYFSKFVWDPLIDKINSDPALAHIEPRHIAVRGTAAALGSPVKLKDGSEARSLEQILRDGSDTGKRELRAAALSKDYDFNEHPGHPPLGHTKAYLPHHATMLRREVAGEGEDQPIYPLMLVYDMRNLEIDSYDVVLPEDPAKRHEAIIKAYVVDYLHQ